MDNEKWRRLVTGNIANSLGSSFFFFGFNIETKTEGCKQIYIFDVSFSVTFRFVSFKPLCIKITFYISFILFLYVNKNIVQLN